tara:strand:+ start:12563 stop:13213 length:651 start_codon:yes stop_codon:yes gene_type:complete
MSKGKGYIILGAVAFGLALVYFLKNSLSKFKRKVLFQSNIEADKWEDFSETDPATSEIIQDYWDRGANRDYSIDEIENATWQSEHPWSAAFISWIMKVSGAGRHFLYSDRHSDYVRDSIQQREVNSKAKFKGYRVEELKPQVTDIVCKRRLGSTADYDNVPVSTPLHCDIVTKVNKKDVEVVGGNINNKVDRANLSLNSKGYLNENDYFVIIRNTL